MTVMISKPQTLIAANLNGVTVELEQSNICDEGALKMCPYMTGVPSLQVHLNVKLQLGLQKMHMRYPDRCPLITGFTVDL